MDIDKKNVAKKKKSQTWIGGLLLFLIALFVILRFIPAQAGGVPADVAGKVVSVNMADTLDVSGLLEAQPFANLIWNTSGVVEEVNVEAGDTVKAGDALMKLNKTSVSTDIRSAQGELVTAQKELEDLLSSTDQDLAQAVIDLKDAQEAYDKANYYLKYLQTSQRVHQTQTKIFIEETFGQWKYRYKSRYFVGPAPAEWILDAENDLALKKAQLGDAQRAYDRIQDGPNIQDVRAAQAKIDAAQATVDLMSIIAPFDGEILYVASQSRDAVNSTTTALNMANLDHLFIEAQVSEADVVRIRVGDPIRATLPSADGLVLTGQVTGIDPLGAVVDGQVEYTLRIDIDPLTEEVSPSLSATANVTIQVGSETTSLAVPIAAMQNDDKGEYVMVLQADGSTKRVDVVSSTIVGDLVTVSGDLKEGDTLTTSLSTGIQPGGPFGGGN